MSLPSLLPHTTRPIQSCPSQWRRAAFQALQVENTAAAWKQPTGYYLLIPAFPECLAAVKIKPYQNSRSSLQSQEALKKAKKKKKKKGKKAASSGAATDEEREETGEGEAGEASAPASAPASRAVSMDGQLGASEEPPAQLPVAAKAAEAAEPPPVAGAP